MIKTMIFFANGNYAACDKNGEQVPKEQGCAWIDIIREKHKRGVVDEWTKVTMAGWGEDLTAGEILKRFAD